ncbi:type IV toxin-antitoxin system AbiEi family antitoxin domain-containing protein [Corynebacterium sanguinis]|nr:MULTISPECIES: type IV toxin-antitoxin system AbiEi family antitoxin domain-containing protein [Corynebacterium]MCT1415106.1 type IV toxin-antitoxin system AbiEi family antitoxin domain-containing protein [Corynebacterium sanguinis]MCT1426522.1 type IV toxin-antitoxin system AbiEi family antitoxin domain-containing protein [Corynebacterium sanguinis]MCT1463975.1 type IV toxin-antitoxin system AbiEi family antitoxin domain-containing protein [Corynebacterium sanguinis]MCT1556089.1 type IV toxi
MKGVEAVEVVGDLASQQWGLVTTAQAAACGVDPQSLQRHEDGGRSVRGF